MMKQLLFFLLIVGLAVAKPSFDSIDDDLIENLANQEVEDVQPKIQNDKVSDNLPLFSKFIHYLIKVSIGKVRPDEHPDRKYQKPVEKLVKKLLVVRKAVIQTFEPLIEIGNLVVHDHKVMMRKVGRALKRNNMHQVKHIVGEYFIALNRRCVQMIIHAEQMGLFRSIDEKKHDEVIKRVKRELDEQARKAKEAVEFILHNFSEYRVSDGLPDRPYVRLGVETAIVYYKAFKQAMKVGKITSTFYIDMISDIVRLALVEKKHEAAVQRAGAGVLSVIRRETKVAVALHRLYSQKKCYGRRKGDEELEHSEDFEMNDAVDA